MVFCVGPLHRGSGGGMYKGRRTETDSLAGQRGLEPLVPPCERVALSGSHRNAEYAKRTISKKSYVAGDRGFESALLQQTVRLWPDFSFLYRKAGSYRGVRGPARRHSRAETRRARQTAAPSLRPSGCRAPGRYRRARSPGRALPFSSRTKQNSALCVAGTDCGLGGRVHAALMQVVVLSEN